MPTYRLTTNNPVPRFLELYSALNTDRRWLQSAQPLRFAALSAISCEGDPVEIAAEIFHLAKQVRDASGWFGELNSDLSFLVATMLHANGDTVQAFLDEVKRTNALFREQSLRNGGVYETMAILGLRIQAGLQPIEKATVLRFKNLYEEMKKYHWWLTGPDDFPACAFLTSRSESTAVIGAKIEAIYQVLHDLDFSKGDPLQTAANLLYLADATPEELGKRFRALADAFDKADISIWQSDYDELATLSFLNHPAEVVVAQLLEHRVGMTKLQPNPGREMTFSLAASLTFIQLVSSDLDSGAITDARGLMDMQAMLQAQQAATVVVIASHGGS